MVQILNTTKVLTYAGGNTEYTIPQNVLQTGLTTNGNMSLTLNSSSEGTGGFLFVHFAELDSMAKTTSRAFWVEPLSTPEFEMLTLVNPSMVYDGDATVFSRYWEVPKLKSDYTKTVQFICSPSSALGPIVNGAELFDVLPQPSLLKTFERDAIAIDGIKSSLKLELSTGDPCLPVPHAWVNCNSLNPPHVTQWTSPITNWQERFLLHSTTLQT